MRRLPLLGFGPVFPGALTPGMDSEKIVLCKAMCACERAWEASGGTGPNRQNCVAKTLWNYDDAFGHQSTIKAEVPYDMSQDPPAPIMSRHFPSRPTRRNPGGSKIPDVVIVKDPTKPPTQDNIKRIVEMKFPRDKRPLNQMDDYRKIAGDDDLVEEMTLEDCNCKEEEPEKQPQTIEDKVTVIMTILAAIALLLADDTSGVGIADDGAIIPLIEKLLEILRPVPAIP